MHKKSVKAEAKRPERDFVALNIAACKSGLTTAQEQTQFRSINDMRRKPPEIEPRVQKPTFPDGMTFGISTRRDQKIRYHVDQSYTTLTDHLRHSLNYWRTDTSKDG